MTPAEPYFREAGAGPGVVCLHSNASSSSQWRGLMESLAPAFHVLAPDSYGSGKSPDWPSDRVITLRDEAALIEPVLAKAGAPLALVGHSYGAAIALVAALDAGDRDAAARHFIDYWMGEGAWAQTPEPRKPAIAASVVNVRRWAHALTTEPAPLAAFRKLDIPVLYMIGKRSTASAHGVARLLTKALPRVEVVEFERLGHMGPVTHPEPVNEAIGAFLGWI